MLFALIAVTAIPLTSCSKDDSDSDSEKETTNTTKTIADPEGTVTINMLIGDDYIWLGNHCPLLIDRGMNFVTQYGEIVDVGEVAGLGNVTSIPENGWSTRALVTPGHGYIFRCIYAIGSEFYSRIYVVNYLESTTGSLIGAQIKYITES